MHLVTCSCGRKYNADELIRCPGCRKLTLELVKETSKKETGAAPLGGTSAAMVSTASIQMLEKALKALLSANTDQTEYLRKIHFWMRYFGIVTVAGGVIALLLFVITVGNAT